MAGALIIGGSRTTEIELPVAEQLLSKGDYKGALIAFKSILQEDPKNTRARQRLGYTLYKMERYPDAEKELRAALERDASDPELKLLLGRILLRQGQADKLLEEVLPVADATRQTRAAILTLRSRALLATRKSAEAEQALQEAERIAAEHPDVLATRAQVWFAAGEHDKALEVMDQAIDRHPDQAELWNAKADMLRLLRRQPEALAAYTRAVKLEPQALPPRLASISLLLDGNDLQKAGAEIKLARQVAPGHLILLYLEAQLDFRHGRHAAAHDKVLQILKVAPDYMPAQLLAGVVSLMTGNRETAINHLTRYLERAPNHDYARKLLATAMVETGQLERARELIAQMSGDTSRDPLLASLRGDIALRSGNLAEAQQQLSLAASQAPDNANLLTQLAGQLLGSGNEAGARQVLEKAAGLADATEKPALMLIMMHLQSKRHEQAMQAVDSLAATLAKSPETARAKAALIPNLRGVVEVARGRNEQARQHFEAALKLNPAYLPAVSNLARLDMLGKDIKAARQRYETYLKGSPGDGKAWMALAELDLLEKNEPAFVSHIEQAKKVSPKDPAPRILASRYWLERRDTGKALAEARSGLDATGNAQFHQLLGAAHMLSGDQKQAIATYRKWLESAPRNPSAHFRMALAQHAAGERGAAMTSLDKTLALDPNHADASLAKVVLLIENRQLPDALGLAQAFAKRNPRTPLGAEAMALALDALGQYAKAAQAWEDAARISGHGRHAALALDAYRKAGQAETGEAYLSAWLDKHPGDIAVRHALAKSMLERGQDRQAASQYNALLKHSPQDLVALNNLANLYGRLKDQRAINTAETALRLAPENPAVLDTYGWLLSEARQGKQGLPYLRKAVAGQPNDPEIRWHLAVTLQRTGDTPGALKELDRLLTSRVAFAQQAEARKLLEQLRAKHP